MRGLFCWALCCAFLACASKSGRRLEPEDLPEPQGVELLWSKKLSGLISDLSMARDGSILVSTIPDPDQEGSEGYRTVKMGSDGEVIWSRDNPGRIKSQTLSRDGSLAVFTNYKGEMYALDAQGQVAWTTEAECHPRIITPVKTIVCYYDDVAMPAVLFDLYGWDGKLKSSYRDERDLLAFKASEDETSFGVGLSGGGVLLFSGQGALKWKRKVNGEVLDVSVSAGDKPQVAVLHGSRSGQMVTMLDSRGRVVSDGKMPAIMEQVELTPAGQEALVYGNSPKGQSLVMFRPERKALNEKWRQDVQRQADYSAALMITEKSAVVGVEDTLGVHRLSALVGYDWEGKSLWRIPVATDEGAYLYAQGISPEKSLVSVATDDARLSAYRVK